MTLKGVRIGENSIAGAGSVIAYAVPASVVAFGNPTRLVWRIGSRATKDWTVSRILRRQRSRVSELIKRRV